MSDKPILFSAPMVRAILDGRKTQTRRVLKMLPDGSVCTKFYQVGDTLWVREAFYGATGYDALPPSKWGNKPIWYDADGDPDRKLWWHLSNRKRPSMFMPRWASRITLEVTDSRVERLQDISRGDAMEEGCPFPNMHAGPDPRDWFKELWQSINGPGSWDASPWVVAYTFEVKGKAPA